MSAVPSTVAPPAARISVRALAWRLALPSLFLASCAFQILQSRGHVTPSVFEDELLYPKLSQSIAAGHWMEIRGEHFWFPSIVAPLLQAPAWLLDSMTASYTYAKALNAVVMSAAVVPAYWIARLVVRRSFALVVAAATVASPAMVYHPYLMTEAAGYPVFLLAVYVFVRAAAEPSRRLGIAVPAVWLLAAATRMQFAVLPLAYVAAVAVCGRWRRQALPFGLFLALGGTVVLLPGALGQYARASEGHYAPGAVAHWMLTNGALLPYSVGLAVVPGALLGVGYALFHPRFRAERAFAAVALTTTVLTIGEAALVSAGEGRRPIERYLFYVTPLVFTGFFAYVERGAPRRIVQLGIAGALGLLLSQFSLSGLTGTAAFFFDSVTETAYANTAFRIGLPNASLLFALLPLALGALAVVAPLGRAKAALFVAFAAIAVELAGGSAVASTDQLVSGFTHRTYSSNPPNWLDESGLGPARYVVLPHADPFVDDDLESWNRNIRGVVLLQTAPQDRFARSVGRVRSDGTLEIDDRPAAPQLLVFNTTGSAVGLEGRVVARPRPGLVAYRIPRGAHVRWLASGLSPDGWTGTRLRYRVWPARPSASGAYRLTLSLPAGEKPRMAELVVAGGAPRHFTIRGGDTLRLRVPVRGVQPPLLQLSMQAPPGPFGGRTLGVRVPSLGYVPRPKP